MKNININHLRVIKRFSSNKQNYKVSDYEKFLSNYVSTPSARKIIRELIEYGIVSIHRSSDDRRVKHLSIVDKDIEKYL